MSKIVRFGVVFALKAILVELTPEVVFARLGQQGTKQNQTTAQLVRVRKECHEGIVASDEIFQLKMFWERGIAWQGSPRARAWFAECGDLCLDREKVLMKECDDENEKQIWIYNQSERKIKSYVNASLCFTFSSKPGVKMIKLRYCRESLKIQQKWIGLDSVRKFQLHPENDISKCLTQEHHPKNEEKLKLEMCSKAEENDRGVNDDTSHWVVGTWDGHDDGCVDNPDPASYSHRVPEVCMGSILVSRERLLRKQFLCGENGRTRFGLDSGGFLVAMRKHGPSWKTYWREKQRGERPGDYLHMQKGGNLVVYTVCGKVQWTSKTSGQSDAYLRISSDTREDEHVQLMWRDHIIWTPP